MPSKLYFSTVVDNDNSHHIKRPRLITPATLSPPSNAEDNTSETIIIDTNIKPNVIPLVIFYITIKYKKMEKYKLFWLPFCNKG
jgi:hypothetical protein